MLRCLKFVVAGMDSTAWLILQYVCQDVMAPSTFASDGLLKLRVPLQRQVPPHIHVREVRGLSLGPLGASCGGGRKWDKPIACECHGR